MVEMIGFATVVGVIWLLASTMGTESVADRRRLSKPTSNAVYVEGGATDTGTKHAA